MRAFVSSLFVATLATGCTVDQSGRWIVLKFETFDLETLINCTETFDDLTCVTDIEPEEDAPVIDTVTEESGPSFTGLLLDQGHPCPTLVIGNQTIFGVAIDDGWRYDFEASEATDRSVSDPSGYSSTYREEELDTFTLTLRDTEDKGVWSISLTETYSITETGVFTDEVDSIAKLQVGTPDSFFWPLNFLVFTGEGYFNDGYAPDEDNCPGDNCNFDFTQTWTLTADGEAKYVADLDDADNINPSGWGQDPGLDGPFFIGLNF